MLIELKDGGIKEIRTDDDSMPGCETCDFGSKYVNEFVVELTKGKIKCEIEDMYEFAVSHDYMMKLFLQNVDEIKTFSEQEFAGWLIRKMKADFEDEVEELEFESDFHEEYISF